MDLLKELSEIMHVKHLTLLMAHSESSKNVRGNEGLYIMKLIMIHFFFFFFNFVLPCKSGGKEKIK